MPPTKGPNDLIAQWRKDKAELERRIAAGESGDGSTKPDLKAQLKALSGQLKMFEDYQKDPRPPKNPLVQSATDNQRGK
jgi:hypothetical protein